MTDDEPISDPDGFDFDAFEASIIDISADHDPYYVKDGTKVPYKPAIRAIEKVTGICLHQTACEMGENPPRYRRLSIHFVVTRSGKVIRTCDMLSLLYGGNGWNNGTVQIEFDGLYPGLEDDLSTVQFNEAMRTTWDDPSTPFRETPQQVTTEAMRTGRNLCRYIVEQWRRSGGEMKVLVSHRQSSGSRQNDPGQAVWQQVALPMHDELELHDGGVGFAIQDGAGGQPIPETWDPRCVGFKY